MKKNRLLITASLVALGIAAPAMAADLHAPVYKAPPPMVTAVYDWSGLYIGINGGGGRTHVGALDASGGTVGGQIGYRWQASNWVFGLEGQGNWADFSASRSTTLLWQGGPCPSVSALFAFVCPVNTLSPGTAGVRTKSFGLFTGQVGYAWNNVLLYLKGGAAVVDNEYYLDCINDGFHCTRGNRVASAETTHWGSTVGAGLEVGFAPNWSVGVEYDHIFLDRKNFDLVVNSVYGGGVRPSGAAQQNIDMGLVRLNYKFTAWSLPTAN